MARENTVRALNKVSTEAFTVAAHRWELTFESEHVEGDVPARASLTLVIVDNQYGNPEDITITAISERSRPKPTDAVRSSSDEFLNYLSSIDLDPIDGMEEGEWGLDEVLLLAETGIFDPAGIPRWIWQAFMDDENIRRTLIEVVRNVTGGITHEEIFEHTLPVRGHLRAV